MNDSTIKAAEARKKHPELQGSSLQLQAAQSGAERGIRDPEHQSRFVARVRVAIADAIERGEPLEVVRLCSAGVQFMGHREVPRADSSD